MIAFFHFEASALGNDWRYWSFSAVLNFKNIELVFTLPEANSAHQPQLHTSEIELKNLAISLSGRIDQFIVCLLC